MSESKINRSLLGYSFSLPHRNYSKKAKTANANYPTRVVTMFPSVQSVAAKADDDCMVSLIGPGFLV